MDVFTEEPRIIRDLVEIWKDPTHLDDEYKERIIFQEFLVIGKFIEGSETPIPLGAMCLNVEQGAKDHSKLVVYTRSQLDVDGQKGGSKITTWLDRTLRTVEEKRTEYVEDCDPRACPAPIKSQSLYTAVQKQGLTVRHEEDSCHDNQVNKRQYPISLARQLISEGASFVLMRLLAIHQYVGQFETATLYLNGDICRNVYMCTGVESGIVNEKRMDVCKIYRQVIEKCGIKHTCSTTLTITGRIVTHEWQDCEYAVYLNPLAQLSAAQRDLPRNKVDWCKDLQLFSTYLDKKQLSLSNCKTYLRDCPDIKQILADYVQTMLQLKPDDVIKFTMEYFKRYSK